MAGDPSPEDRERIGRLIERRQAHRRRMASSRAAREAVDAARARQAAIVRMHVGNALAARQAAYRRDLIEASRLEAERANAVAAWQQARATKYLADAITYDAWAGRGRGYRWP